MRFESRLARITGLLAFFPSSNEAALYAIQKPQNCVECESSSRKGRKGVPAVVSEGDYNYNTLEEFSM